MDKETTAVGQQDQALEQTPEEAKEPDGIVSISRDGALSDEEIERITGELIGAIKSVYDPEIPVDIYELGLIYKLDLDETI